MNKLIKVVSFWFLMLALCFNVSAATFPTPILEYLFNDSGNETLNTGSSPSKKLMTYTSSGLTDVHSASGLGISGLPTDIAFDNSQATKMGKGTGLAYGRGVTEEFGADLMELQTSLTVQGWFKANEIIKNNAVIIQIPQKIVLMANMDIPGAIDVSVNKRLATSPAVYNKVDEWVFFAVTLDLTDKSDNIVFYIGSKTDPVEVAGTATSEWYMVHSANNLDRVWLGDLAAASFTRDFIRPFRGYLDNIRIFGSESDDSGVLTLAQLEALRIRDCGILPSQENSNILLEPNKQLADGQSTIKVEIAVKDADDNPLVGYPVTISKVEGSGDLEVGNQQTYTDAQGLAIFNVTSEEFGSARLQATVHPLVGEPFFLEEQPVLEFFQVVNLEMTKKESIVSADNESFYTVEVVVTDIDNNPVANKVISLSASKNLTVLEEETSTNQDGIASFKVKAIDSLEPVSGSVTAKADDYFEEELILTFAGRLKFADEGSDPLTSLSITRELAVGLVGISEDDLPVDAIPTDGISKWKIKAKLVGDAVEQRTVTVALDSTEGIDIHPANALMPTSDGEVCFYLSSTSVVGEIGVTVAVEKDANAIWKSTIKFVSDSELGLYVTNVYPSAKNADITKPFEVKFNKEIKLAQGAEFSFEPESERGAIYGESGLDELWSIKEGKTLVWAHERLNSNIEYTVTLTGIKDIDGNLMKPFSWKFEATDLEKPYVMLTEPASGAVNIPLDAEIRVRFSEDLKVEGNHPENLEILIKGPEGERILTQGEYQYFPVDFAQSKNYSEVVFLFPLKKNAIYDVQLSGAFDFGSNTMVPYSFFFSTISDQNAGISRIVVDTNDVGDMLVGSEVTLHFNTSIEFSQQSEIVVTEKGTPNPIPGTTTPLYSGGKVTGLSFKPTVGAFAYDTLYTVSLVEVIDEEGNPLDYEPISLLTEVTASPVLTLVPGDERKEYDFPVPRISGEKAHVKVSVPARGLMNISDLQVRNVHVSDHPVYIAGLYNDQFALTPEIYDFHIPGQTGNIIFSEPAILSIPFKDDGQGQVQSLQGKLVPADSLRIFRWDSIRNSWIPLGGEVDLVEKTVSVEIEQFSIYALIGVGAPPSQFLSGVSLTINPLAPGGDGHRNETTFMFGLSHNSKVKLVLYDRQGRLVGTLINDEIYSKGPVNAYTWDGTIDGRKLRPGIYFYRLFATSVESEFPDNAWASGAIGIVH